MRKNILRTRKPATLTASVNPVVLRAFRNVCRRAGFSSRHDQGGSIINRLLVCFVLSTRNDRCGIVRAGMYDSMLRRPERDRYLAETAEFIVKGRFIS